MFMGYSLLLMHVVNYAFMKNIKWLPAAPLSHIISCGHCLQNACSHFTCVQSWFSFHCTFEVRSYTRTRDKDRLFKQSRNKTVTQMERFHLLYKVFIS